MSLKMSDYLLDRLNKILHEHLNELDLGIEVLKVKHSFGNHEITIRVELCKDDEVVFSFPETVVWEEDRLYIKGLKFTYDASIKGDS